METKLVRIVQIAKELMDKIIWRAECLNWTGSDLWGVGYQLAMEQILWHFHEETGKNGEYKAVPKVKRCSSTRLTLI